MARRRRQQSTPIEDMFEFLKVVPAWVGPVVAVSVFLLLRYVLPVLLPKPSGGFDRGTLIRQFMPLFAWLLGGGLLLAWVAAKIHKLSNRVLFDRQTGIGSVRDLSWQRFEHLVSEAYRRRGYTAKVVGSPSGDGGVDIGLPGEARARSSIKREVPAERTESGLVRSHSTFQVSLCPDQQ